MQTNMKAPLLNVCIINTFAGWRTQALHKIIAGCQYYCAEYVDQKVQAMHPVLCGRIFTMAEYGRVWQRKSFDHQSFLSM